MLTALLFGSGMAVNGQPEPLAVWRFEPAQLAGNEGPQSRTADSGERVQGIRGRAVRFTERADPLIVALPTRRNGGALDPTAMSVRMWYRPEWTSRGGRTEGGPGEWVRLMSMGDRAGKPADGWWELSIHPSGNTFEFSCGSGARDSFAVTSLPMAFQSGVWTEIVLNVFSGRLLGFKDGQVAFDANPAKLPSPSRSVLQQGLAIGSRPNGTEAARGSLDEIEVFDSLWNRVEVAKLGRVMSVLPLPAGEGLGVAWKLPPTENAELQRADGGKTNWTSLSQIAGLRQFSDPGIQPGQLYHYRILTNGVRVSLEATAGLRLPPIEDRGTVLLLVDETHANDLQGDLARYERDQVADGWRVIRRTVPRHNDQDWRSNTNAIQKIRALVQGEWRASSNALKAIFLIGHVAIPYSGMLAEDTHTGRGDNHLGAWPADQYYADIDGIWTDAGPYPSYLAPPKFPITHNVAGDGKFDTAWVAPNEKGDTRLEMAFGRVDFVAMPAFGRGQKGELQLLRQYFEKTRRFRTGGMPATPRAVIGPYVNSGTDFNLFPSAYRTGSRLFGLSSTEVLEGDLFGLPDGETAVWGFQSGLANIDRIRTGTPAALVSTTLADPRRQARVLYAMLLGSWFGDWAIGENNMVRSVIASRDHGLAAFWVRYTEWRFDPMARGGTLGDAQLLTANDVVVAMDPNKGTTRTLTIHGDPTLRLHATTPPAGVRGARSGKAVRLNWQRSREASAYLVYRSGSGWQGPYERVTPSAIPETQFQDTESPPSSVYLVRAAQLIPTASGSYTNLSQGIFWPEAR